MRFLPILLLCSGAAAEVPIPIRDTAFDWVCVDENGTQMPDSAGTVNFQRMDRAMAVCQNAADANPGAEYRFYSGIYRVRTEPGSVDPVVCPECVTDCPACPAADLVDTFALDLTNGTLTMEIFDTPVDQVPRSIISQGDWAGEAFGVWIWNGEVHVRFGQGTYRPAGPHLTGGTHRIAISWGANGLSVVADDRVTIRDPKNTRTMPRGEMAIGTPPTTHYTAMDAESICAAVSNKELSGIACPSAPATFNGEAIPCAL